MLTFNYTVAAGQSAADLDYASTAALTANGGSIANAAGASAVLTLPATGTDGLAEKHIAVATQPVKLSAKTTLTGDLPNPAVFGQRVTLKAAVAAAAKGGAAPTGTVTFMEGTTVLGSGTLANGAAALTTSALAVGSDTITAVYNGNAIYGPSTSPAVTSVVNRAGTTAALADLAKGHASTFGQAVTFTVTVKAAAPGAGQPTGSVTFEDNGSPLSGGTLSLANGTASFTTSVLAVGSQKITAVYSGDDNFTASTSAAITHKVSQAAAAPPVAIPALAGTPPSALGAAASPDQAARDRCSPGKSISGDRRRGEGPSLPGGPLGNRDITPMCQQWGGNCRCPPRVGGLVTQEV